MTEVLDNVPEITTEQETDIPKVIRWEKTPDPVVREVSLALLNQIKKQRALNLDHQPYSEGVYLLPNWRGAKIIKMGQRRGVKDLWPRGSSAHNVAFCIAEVRDQRGIITNRNVAIKMFHRSTGAIKDATNNAMVLQRGFSTTNPIAVIVDEANSYVISPAVKGIQQLDTEPWHQFSTGTDAVREHFIYRLQQIGEMLADLHAKGINHSDAQVKNFWVTINGEIQPFDWEAANIYHNPLNPQDLLVMGIDDLRTLYLSVTNQYPESPVPALVGSKRTQWSQFKDYILGPYGDRLLKILPSDQLPETDLLDVVVNIEETLQNQLNITG